MLFAYEAIPGWSFTRQSYLAVNGPTPGFSEEDLILNVSGINGSFAGGELPVETLFSTL